jgi:plastocyanin
MLCIVTAITVGSAHAADLEVKIDNFTFNPQQITVKAGTTVTWTNHDDIPHTVTSSTQAFKSKVLDTDEKFSFTFTTPGSYPYFCSLHPHMTGSIVVEASAGK